MDAQLDGILKMHAHNANVEWFDYQVRCFEHAWGLSRVGSPPRMCLYYRTGAGKSITALVCLDLMGYTRAVVIAPPSTHDTWVKQAEQLHLKIECMSHAKFRMKDTKLNRHTAVIADEMHLFGGHVGKGWKKLDQLARGLKAPLILASATPSYNDAERVYCVQHILDPAACKGGFLQFLYQNCTTEQNPFRQTPDVTGFLHHKDAEAFLASLSGVMYLPDNLVYQIKDIPIAEKIPPEMELLGYNPRKRKMISSIIEARHARIALSLTYKDNTVQDDVYSAVIEKTYANEGQVLIFCNHSSVARALHLTMTQRENFAVGLITGDTSMKQKMLMLDEFRSGKTEVLIGTASLATGTDGLDKVCDTLIIVDDTDDDALRRQLIGRIMPRGKAPGATHNKKVYRLTIN